MTEVGPWIALASLVVSLTVLVFGWIQYRRLARKDYVEALDRELELVRNKADRCEEERHRILAKVEECESGRARLERERLDLLLEVRALRSPPPAQPEGL